MKDWKIIPFRDIKDTYLPKNPIPLRDLPKNWLFPFYVDTVSRIYVLCAKTE